MRAYLESSACHWSWITLNKERTNNNNTLRVYCRISRNRAILKGCHPVVTYNMCFKLQILCYVYISIEANKLRTCLDYKNMTQELND